MINQPVALVTGSSHGIGRAIALELATQGYCVVINGRTADPAETATGAYEVKARIEQAGGQAEVITGDISLAEDRLRLLDTIDARLGRLDLLVNNAGVAPEQRADILEASEASFDRLMTINLKGPYFLTQLAANRMIACRESGAVPRPRIAFVTSISAYTASTSRGEYCISKAGLSMAVALWADRLGEFDIPVIEIRPGVIQTRMTSGVQGKYDALIEQGIFPQRRWGQPEDVARAIGAFARGDLDYSTGVAIDVSGGFQLHRL